VCAWVEEDLFVYVVIGPLLVLPPPVVQLGLSLGSVRFGSVRLFVLILVR
jgi:hypothetical protein